MLGFSFFPGDPESVTESEIAYSVRPGCLCLRVSSYCRLMANFLSHLFGAVIGEAETHDGQHHGDLVDGAVARRGLDISCYLPLQETEVSRSQSAESDDHRCWGGGCAPHGRNEAPDCCLSQKREPCCNCTLVQGTKGDSVEVAPRQNPHTAGMEKPVSCKTAFLAAEVGF